MSAQKASPPAARSPEHTQWRAVPAARVDVDARMQQATLPPADPPLSPAALQLHQRILSIREKLASSALPAEQFRAEVNNPLICTSSTQQT
jgi:hypothetical protein